MATFDTVPIVIPMNSWGLPVFQSSKYVPKGYAPESPSVPCRKKLFAPAALRLMRDCSHFLFSTPSPK